MNTPLVSIKNLYYHYRKKGRALPILQNLSFDIFEGETFGLVGESGSGKTTLAKLLVSLLEPSSGAISFAGKELHTCTSEERKMLRRQIQMVFQNPYTSLNPRMRVGDIVEEPLVIFKTDPPSVRKEKVVKILHQVGLGPSFQEKYPHELSGGQRQRVALARSLILNPKFLILDEPISALDVSIQAQMINLLKELQESLHLTYLFISHDLSLVKYLSDRVAVLYFGQIVELGESEELYKNPLHPYTKALFSAIPRLPVPGEKKVIRTILPGEPPSIFSQIQGCPFASRCPKVEGRCKELAPSSREIAGDHLVSCHLVE